MNDYTELRRQLRTFYAGLLPEMERDPAHYRHPMTCMIEEAVSRCPGADLYRQKEIQYEVIAEQFQPVIFPGIPFYFEMGTKSPQGDGQPGFPHPGSWLFRSHSDLWRAEIPREIRRFERMVEERVFLSCGPFVDLDHHCPPFSNVLAGGLQAIYRRCEEALPECVDEHERGFLRCAMAGLRAVRRIGERFAESARTMQKQTDDPAERRNLEAIAASAVRVPWEAPANFREGLNTLWFLREVLASLEGVGMNSLGHPDRMLYELYRHDLATGALTPDEARDLVAKFQLIADCHYDRDSIVRGYGDHEYELTYTLGGCNAEGAIIYNEVTDLFFDTHRELNLIYPKPHCRFSAASPQPYLDRINRDLLAGRCVYSLINDDTAIPALVRAGKLLEDARQYLCTGCWDLVVESRENLDTGNYFSMPRILEMTIHPLPETSELGLALTPLDDATDFETVYRRLTDNIIAAICDMCEAKRRYGGMIARVNPLPLFSACLSGCVEQRRDVTEGGARYNPHALPMLGFANIVDTLAVIETLCFRRKSCTLAALLDAVRHNWEGHEALRLEALAAPHFGDNSTASNAIAGRLHHELYERTADLVNEKGGHFQLGYWCYREFRFWGEKMRATPDGRRDGDWLALSLSPSRLKPVRNLTDTLHAAGGLDLRLCPGDSVLNLVLPCGGLDAATLEQFERTAATLGLQLLQLNCVDKAELEDARIHPENHQNLIVRICGFSAKFTSLSPEWQEEFIRRNIYG